MRRQESEGERGGSGWKGGDSGSGEAGGEEDGTPSTRSVRPMRFGTYNIQKYQKGGSDSALRGILFQDTKVTSEVYTRESSGYRVVAPETPSAHSGGVAVFYHVAEHLSVEALHIYSANVASFQLASGGQKWSWGANWPQTTPQQ